MTFITPMDYITWKYLTNSRMKLPTTKRELEKMYNTFRDLSYKALCKEDKLLVKAISSFSQKILKKYNQLG
jgi:hypothetical protein